MESWSERRGWSIRGQKCRSTWPPRIPLRRQSQIDFRCTMAITMLPVGCMAKEDPRTWLYRCWILLTKLSWKSLEMFGCGWHYETPWYEQLLSCKLQSSQSTKLRTSPISKQLTTSTSRTKLSGPQCFANKASQLPRLSAWWVFEKSFISLSLLRMAFNSLVARSFTCHRPAWASYCSKTPCLKVSQVMTEQQGR